MASRQLIREPVNYTAKPRKHRKPGERLWLRFRFMIPLTTKWILGRPPNSRIRRRLVMYWVRTSYEIVNRRDFELALAGQHPDTVIEWRVGPDDPFPLDLISDVFRGHEGFRRAWQAWLDAFDDLTIVPEEVTDTGGNQLLVGLRTIGTGTHSGIPVDDYSFTLYTFEDGLVARQDWFRDREAAERAAGLIQ